VFIDAQPAPLLDPESSADIAWSMRERLSLIADLPVGQDLVRRALVPILANPYPRYRDIALAALGGALLASRRRHSVRRQLQAVLRAGLDDEGVTFTFDLPSVVLAEWERRGQSAPDLERFVDTARTCRDPWGTSARALSAKSAVAYRQGRVDEAFALLLQASKEPTTYAGYAVTGVLGLLDRCHEFGAPERAREPVWGPAGTETLPDLAHAVANLVYEPVFRQERLELVRRHAEWSRDAFPDAHQVITAVSSIAEQDTRMAYACHLSARYAASPSPSLAVTGLKALLPLALFDSTALDTVLGRLIGVLAADLDQEMGDLVLLTSAELTTGRPWMLGSWH
jgi:hypothetical protein